MKNSKLTALLMGIALAGANFACMPSENVSAIGIITKSTDAYLKNPDFVIREGGKITDRMLYDHGILILREVVLYHDLKIDERYGQEDPCDYWIIENPTEYTADDYTLNEGKNTLIFRGPHDYTFELTVNVTFAEESEKESDFVPGDINHDGIADKKDLELLNSCQGFLKCDKSESPISDDGLVKADYMIYDFQAADINQDGDIDFIDEEYLSANHFNADEIIGAQDPEPESKNVTVGDINTDGMIDLSDLTSLSLVLLGDAKNADGKISDVNADGELNIADLAHFKQYIMHEDGIKLGS